MEKIFSQKKKIPPQIIFLKNTLSNLSKERRDKKMKFWFDFEGYCSIEAETEEEAEKKFWTEIYSHSLIEAGLK